MADQAAVDPRGYVKIWRRLSDHPVWNSPNLAARVLFIHLLMNANWKPGKFVCEGRVIDVGPGETVTSLRQLGVKMSVTVKIIRGALTVLKRAQVITIIGARRYTKITLTNWTRWQAPESVEGTTSDVTKGTSEGTTGAQQGHNWGTTGATIKEGKKVRREEEPLLSDEKSSSDSTVLELTSLDVGGRGKRKPKKLVKSETMGWQPWKLAAWQVIYSEDPKKFYAAGALEIFDEAVETEDQAAWLMRVHREQCAACPPVKWPGLCSWLKGQTKAMRSGVTAEQASSGMEAF